MINNELVFKSIAEALLSEYLCVYFVNAATNEYIFYTADSWFRSLHKGLDGKDFYADVIKVTEKVIYEDDKYIFLNENLRDLLLSQVENDAVHLTPYRLVIDGEPVYFRSKLIRGIDREDGCFIIGVKNVDKQVKERLRAEIYNQIAGSLAEHYDTVYYVDIETNNYFEYSSTDIYKSMQVPETGEDFFAETRKNMKKYIHPEDQARIMPKFEREAMLKNLSDAKICSEKYRLVVNGEIMHCRCSQMRANDKKHILVCIENINDEVKKEQEQIAALDRANELARCDGLTGAKNMTAYREFEDSMQKSMDSGKGRPCFAIVVCDINDLKRVNDLGGHKLGDEHIRSACRMISSVFAHSLVFRIGGDEFAVVLAGSDYEKRSQLVEILKKRSRENLENGAGPAVAVGFAVYDELNDRNVSDVFNRADDSMYADKVDLKSGKTYAAAQKTEKMAARIPAERKRLLDGLFETLAVVNDQDYVYICDMLYDYSRWSKAAVDSYGLPSEYMYGAGNIWEEFVHEEDREIYHNVISDIFAGGETSHDMQYRARRINGEYNVCTCRGIVLKNKNGEPEYFIGSIKDHGVQSYIDSLTGLRNQYGFFEDLRTKLIQNQKMLVANIGIAKFSEINEIYGYHFGNLVLQKFGRFLFEHLGNYGNAYRLDGTKFAIIGSNLSMDEAQARYEDLRACFREGIDIDDRHILFELNASIIDVDNFNIDTQTIMTCLTFAYNESKTRRHGDMVRFNSDLGSGSRQNIERFHAIRASITKGYKGFYLLYQPVVDAKTEKLIGAEALLRWKNDEYGVVPPDDFIPLLEKDPLFPDLGRWILTTAVKNAKKMLETDPDFVINVNLSYTQLEKTGFVDMVMDILDQAGYPPKHLCLEITERCRLLDIDLLKNIVVSLRGKGVQIALDDFGTGFSSIGIVKNLPFDTIKIDRSFVMQIEEDAVERELIRSFVHVAATCGAAVCIEGVETSGMGEILRQYNVHSFQGYYYSKPLEYEAFLAWRKGASGLR